MKIRNRIFLVLAIVLGAGMFWYATWVTDDLKSRYNESLEEPLVDTAHILAETLGVNVVRGVLQGEELVNAFDRIYQRRFSARIFGLEKHQVDLRIYVTDHKGIVLFDSYYPDKLGEDYSRWNDVARTLDGEYGARSSPILKKPNQVDLAFHPASEKGGSDDAMNMAFVAAPIFDRGKMIGVLSVGKPKHNIARFLNLARKNQITVAIWVVGVSLLFGLVAYHWVSRPLGRLANYASRVAKGERLEMPDLGKNEVGEAAHSVEKMREVLEGKEYSKRYVQTLTHELKSPLSAIQGAAELLVEDLPPEQQKRFSQNIRQEAKRLEDMVSRLLQLASLEKRRSLESIETIDLSQLIVSVAQSVEAKLTNAGLTLVNESEPGLFAQGERFLLFQSLDNVLRNAIDFSPPGGEIRIQAGAPTPTVENQTSDQHYLRIDIIDQGPGIPEYAKERIFERFYSLPRPGNAKKSTGLGLNLVKEVMVLHGGEIHFDRLGQTTCVTLWLPQNQR